MADPVRLKIVNVADPEEIAEALNDCKADEQILKTIQRNHHRVREVITEKPGLSPELQGFFIFLALLWSAGITFYLCLTHV